MNWQAIRGAIHSPSELVAAARKAVPVVYSDFVRPLLPKTGDVVKYNGVPVAEKRWLDDRLPSYVTQYVQSDPQPDYEGQLIAEVREHVSEGDTVVVVRGGLGVSSVAAGVEAGGNGTVHVYEGSEKHCELIARTVELNRVRAEYEIHHAIVGVGKSLRAHPGDASILDPSALPKCDILELDCEGSERTILENLSIRPRTIIVETHATLGAPKDEIVPILRDKGYRITNERSVDAETGIDIVTATDG